MMFIPEPRLSPPLLAWLLVVLIAPWCSLAAEPEGAAQGSAAVAPTDQEMQAIWDWARTNTRLEKAKVIAENLPMTGTEADKFWPLHREYEAALTKLVDRKISILRTLVKDSETMTDQQALELGKQALDLEADRVELKRTYFEKFQQAIPAKKVVRFFQIENQLNMALELQVAAAMPLVK
jgi:hypothetical protein